MGLQIITPPWAPPNTIYVVDPSAFDVFPADVQWGEPVQVADRASFTVGMRLAFGLHTRVESDPFDWPRARSLHALWRQVRAIFGYEFRKHSGRLRRVPRNTAVITNLSA